MHTPHDFLHADMLSRRSCWGLCFGLIALLGCQPSGPAPKSPEQVIAEAKQTVREAEAVIAAVKETDKATVGVVAEAQPATPEVAKPAAKNDPLKDVAPPGPVVPYFNPLTEAEIHEGWISLFDGHSLFGWESNASDVNWAVAEGSITADAGPKGLLLTYTPFADYQFRCDYKMAAGGNSGVFLRTLHEPKDVLKDCYEVNIVDEHPEGYLTGSIVGLQKTAEPIQGSGDWHTLLLAANGTKITVAIDGKEVCAYDDTRPEARRSGLIGLQKNAGKIEFRNITLKPLNQKPLFNGTDLTGWRTVPGSKGEFTVAEGSIHVKGGEGFLESESQHKDFVLQAQARTNAEAVNTGIFFRAEAGTEKAKSNGYESQIDFSRTESEASAPGADAPKNAGTGAIFRRVNARRVVGKDNEWATVTLIASGPRFSTYVNGYAVVHWEDTRKPDPNPRKGQRLEAGHFSLQGHDPGTDASFKAITVSVLP
jgi:Domain of Unknown Function (DUF1080)